MKLWTAICLIALCLTSAAGQERDRLSVSKRYDFWRCEKPMADILDQSKVTAGGGSQVFQIGCDMPSSTSDDILALFVAFVQYRDFNATMLTPSGWTGSDVTTVPAGIAIYYRTGGHTTPVTIYFTGNDVCAVAICFTISNQKLTSPLLFGSSHSSGGLGHTFVAAQTAPLPGSVFVGALTSPDSNTQIIADSNGFANFGGGMTKLGIPPYVAGGQNPLTIAYYIAGSAGESGLLSFTTYTEYNPIIKAANVSGVGFWISPSQAPSAMTFTAPTTGLQYAIGREVPVTWQAASDPNFASSLLTYDLEYTTNGFTWLTLATTGAGDTSYLWDTAGLSASTTVQVRGRAYNGTEYGPYAYSSVFTLLTDAAPGAPQDVRPTGIVNQTEDLTITFTFNDPGDLQKTLEVQYSVNADMSSPSTTGTITTSDAFYTFTASTGILATTGVRYYRVRNQGIVDSTNGAWSATKSIDVRAPISAPNITFPTAASPPESGTVTALFTGTGHTQVKYEIDREGTPVYFSDTEFLSGNSIPLEFGFDNDTNYTLRLYRAASDGLWSLADSETFLVSYDGPDVPILTALVVNEGGYIQLSAVNSDSPVSQDLLVNGVVVATGLPPDFVFLYAGARSGELQTFKVKAYKAVTLGYTYSEEVTATQNLDGLFIYEPTQELTTANFVAAPIRVLADSNEPEINTGLAMVRLRKRVKQVAHFRRGHWRVLNYSVMVPVPQISVANQLESWLENATTICARDNFKHKVNGNITGLDVADYLASIRTPLVITENSDTEEVV